MTNKGTASDRPDGELFASRITAGPSTPFAHRFRARLDLVTAWTRAATSRQRSARLLHAIRLLVHRALYVRRSNALRGKLECAVLQRGRRELAGAGIRNAREHALRDVGWQYLSQARRRGSLAGVCALDPRATMKAARKSSATLRVFVIGFSFWELPGPPTQRNAARYQSIGAPMHTRLSARLPRSHLPLVIRR